MGASDSPPISRKKTRRPGWLVLLLFAFPAVTPGAVAADDFGIGPAASNGATGWLADNAAHSYCFTSGFDADLHQLAHDVMLHSLNNSTDMTRHFESCANQTDVWLFETNLEPGVRGATSCPAIHLLGQVCSSHDVMIDAAELRIGANDDDDIKKTLCHEIGHSVGLTHHLPGATLATDCMIRGEIPNTDGQWKHYNTHHKSHINLQY